MCAGALLYVCVCSAWHMCICAHRGQRSTLVPFLRCSPSVLFFETWIMLGCWPRTVTAFTVVGLQVWATTAVFFMWVLGLRLRSPCSPWQVLALRSHLTNSAHFCLVPLSLCSHFYSSHHFLPPPRSCPKMSKDPSPIQCHPKPGCLQVFQTPALTSVAAGKSLLNGVALSIFSPRCGLPGVS